MAVNPAISDAAVKVVIAPDGLSAWVELGEADRALPAPEAVLAAMQKAGVKVDEAGKKLVDETLALAAGGGEKRASRLVVAKGRPPENGRDEELVWDKVFQRQMQDWRGDAPVDYYTFNSIVTVAKDAVLGRTTPATAGKEGVDVRGRRIPAHGSGRPLQLDGTVRRSEQDPAVILANTTGRVVLADQRLQIEEICEIKGNVDFSTGNIKAPVGVHVRGTVQDRFEVVSGGGLTIDGGVEGSRLQAGGDITVQGGIAARHNGEIRAIGSLVAKFCQEAMIWTGGDVKVIREVMNCRVHCLGRLLAERGAVIGGYVYARGGAAVSALGSDANVPTRIALGVHPAVLQQAEKMVADVKAIREGVDRIREVVTPLMKNLKRLTAAQKEQATELLFKADEAESRIADVEKRRTDLLERCMPRERPQVLVHRIAYPGTIIYIGARVTSLHKELKGPVVIEERKVENATEIVAVSTLTGSLQVLPNAHLPLGDLAKGLPPYEDFAKQLQPLDGAAEASTASSPAKPA